MIKKLYIQRIEQKFFRLLISKILKLSDPFWKQINFSRIQLNAEVTQCKIYFTIFGDMSKEVALKKLNDKRGFLKKILSQNWNLHHFPKLIFIYDQKLIDAENLTNLLSSEK